MSEGCKYKSSKETLNEIENRVCYSLGIRRKKERKGQKEKMGISMAISVL